MLPGRGPRMRSLDGLPWTAGLAFVCYGVRFGVRVQHAAHLQAVAERLPPLRRAVASMSVELLYSLRTVEGGGVTAFAGARRLGRPGTLEEALDALESDLCTEVALRAHDRIFLHAGVVTVRGRAILLPGRSMCGKSTLVRALVEAGATYYSDEYAVIDRHGRVHPYPRRLSIRVPAGEGRPLRLQPEKLGRVGSRSVPVTLIVITRFRPDAAFNPAPLAPGRAFLALFKNVVAARRRSGEALACLSGIVSSAPALKGPRGDARETAQDILRALSAKIA